MNLPSQRSDQPPTVVALYRADHVSGINATARRMAAMPAPHTRWTPLMVGEGLDPDARTLPGFGDLACRVATWTPGADPVSQALSVLEALRDMRATIVVPNDIPHGFVAAGLDHHAGLRCAAWLHADDLNGDDLAERCGPLADCWRAVSADIQRRAGAIGTLPARASADHVPCPVDVPDVAPPSRRPNDTINLLYAGRLERFQKRALDLPVLCDALLSLGVRFHLRIAGRGPAEPDLRERLDTHTRAGRVTMLGPVPADRMHLQHAWSDALVLVSAYEGTPVIGMEAMAAARPVFTTSGGGGIVPIIQATQSGAVTDIGDMGAMATAIASHHSASLARMGERAHAAALLHFSTRAIGPAIDQWMHEAAGAPARVDTGDPGSIAAQWASILRALGTIGPCPEPSLRALATRWLGTLGRPQMAGALATWLPQAAGPRERLFNQTIDRIASRALRRIALYGAGLHTRRLETPIASRSEIIAIVDDRAGETGIPTSIGGRPVIAPRALAALCPDAVLISSDEHEQPMIRAALGWSGAGLCDAPIIPLYGVRPTIGLRALESGARNTSISAQTPQATRRAG